MKKIKDRIILGIICGLLANIPKAVANEILFRKKIESKRYGEVISGIFMPKKQALSKKGRLFGVGGDFVTSSILGIPLVYLMSFAGKDSFLLKGLVAGVVGLGGFRGLLANVGPGQTYPRDPITNITFSMNSAMWGLVASTLAVLLGDESLFKPSRAKNNFLSEPVNLNTSSNQYEGEVNNKNRFRRYIVPVPVKEKEIK